MHSDQFKQKNPHLEPIKKIHIFRKWPASFNTRTGGGGRFCPSHLFFANNLKMTERGAAKFGIPAHNSRTHLVCKFWLPRSKGQVTMSGQSQMCTSGPASNFNFALWAHLLSEWFESLRMRYWRGCQQIVYLRFFHFGDLGPGQFSARPIITLWGNYFSTKNFWTSGGRRLKVVSKRLSRGPKSNDRWVGHVWMSWAYPSSLTSTAQGGRGSEIQLDMYRLIGRNWNTSISCMESEKVMDEIKYFSSIWSKTLRYVYYAPCHVAQELVRTLVLKALFTLKNGNMNLAAGSPVLDFSNVLAGAGSLCYCCPDDVSDVLGAEDVSFLLARWAGDGSLIESFRNGLHALSSLEPTCNICVTTDVLFTSRITIVRPRAGVSS